MDYGQDTHSTGQTSDGSNQPIFPTDGVGETPANQNPDIEGSLNTNAWLPDSPDKKHLGNTIINLSATEYDQDTSTNPIREDDGSHSDSMGEVIDLQMPPLMGNEPIDGESTSLAPQTIPVKHHESTQKSAETVKASIAEFNRNPDPNLVDFYEEMQEMRSQFTAREAA